MVNLCLVLVSFVIGGVYASTIPPVNASTCTYNGKVYNEGPFKPSPCEPCQCTGGRAYCAIVDCAPPSCVDSVRRPDMCCSVCPNGQNCDYKGHTIKHGESYHPDANTECRCPDNPFHFGLGGSIGPTAICVHRPVLHTVQPVS